MYANQCQSSVSLIESMGGAAVKRKFVVYSTLKSVPELYTGTAKALLR